MNATNEVAVIKTSGGDIVVQFWTDAAPHDRQLSRSSRGPVFTTARFSIGL